MRFFRKDFFRKSFSGLTIFKWSLFPDDWFSVISERKPNASCSSSGNIRLLSMSQQDAGFVALNLYHRESLSKRKRRGVSETQKKKNPRRYKNRPIVSVSRTIIVLKRPIRRTGELDRIQFKTELLHF